MVDVSKALMWVSEMFDAGNLVICDKGSGIDEGRVARKESGIQIQFVRRNGVYEEDWCILPVQGEGPVARLCDSETCLGCRLNKTTSWASMSGECKKGRRMSRHADKVAAHIVTHEWSRAWPCLCDRSWLVLQPHRQ